MSYKRCNQFIKLRSFCISLSKADDDLLCPDHLVLWDDRGKVAKTENWEIHRKGYEQSRIKLLEARLRNKLAGPSQPNLRLKISRLTFLVILLVIYTKNYYLPNTISDILAICNKITIYLLEIPKINVKVGP